VLCLTLLATAVVENRLANPDVANNPESVLRRVMPLDFASAGRGVCGAVIRVSHASLGSHRWRGHCRELLRIPVAA